VTRRCRYTAGRAAGQPAIWSARNIRVVASAVDERRTPAVLVSQADPVKAGHIGHASAMPKKAVPVQHRHAQPGIGGPISGRPDHRGHARSTQIHSGHRRRHWNGRRRVGRLEGRRRPGPRVLLNLTEHAEQPLLRCAHGVAKVIGEVGDRAVQRPQPAGEPDPGLLQHAEVDPPGLGAAAELQ